MNPGKPYLLRFVRTPVAGALLFAFLGAVPAASNEGALPGEPSIPWRIHIQRVTMALAQNNLKVAVRAWYDAYLSALGSRRWEGLVEVADAYLRIGEVSGFRMESEPKARQLYLAALFRARNEGSLDGVLRAAEVFAALGDREVVARCIRMAETLAEQRKDPQAQARVQYFAQRMEDRLLASAAP